MRFRTRFTRLGDRVREMASVQPAQSCSSSQIIGRRGLDIRASATMAAGSRPAAAPRALTGGTNSRPIIPARTPQNFMKSRRVRPLSVSSS